MRLKYPSHLKWCICPHQCMSNFNWCICPPLLNHWSGFYTLKCYFCQYLKNQILKCHILKLQSPVWGGGGEKYTS